MNTAFKLKLQPQFALLLLVIVAAMATVASLMLSDMHQQLESERKLRVRELTEVANSVLVRFHKEQLSGRLSQEEAQQRAAEALSGMVFEDTYPTIRTLAGIYVMHPTKPELVGKRPTSKDYAGRNLSDAYVEEARKGGGSGYVSYPFPRPGSDVAEPKLSYGRVFEPWGWVVAVGLYVADIDTTYAKQRSAVLMAFGLVTLLVGAALWWQARRIVGQVRAVLAFARRLAANDLSTELAITARDEFGDMALALNQAQAGMREAFTHVEAAAASDREKMARLQAAEAQQQAQAREIAEQAEQIRADAEQQQQHARDVQAKVERLLAATENAAQGDLTRESGVSGDDNVGQVGRAVTHLLRDLRASISGIARNAESLSAAASEASGLSSRMDGIAEDTAARAEQLAKATGNVDA
ncbi:cache domain-containing protein, partial [Plasticicumulans acidivorans]